jgi:hypothetical protein
MFDAGPALRMLCGLVLGPCDWQFPNDPRLKYMTKHTISLE